MKLPIEVHNKLIPFKGFSWVTWLVFAFTRKPMAWSMDETTRRHEGIHCAQQIELAGLFAAILLPVAISYSFAWWGWVLTVVGILFADDLLRPVFDWSAQQVIDYILDEGLEPNPLYRMGYKRVGCWPCVMANQRDILNIARQAPERIDYIAKIEQELQCGDRLRSEFFGPDKIPAHAITSGNQYANIYDVVRYVEWQHATGSLFDDDTATSCVSYYGLCE